MSLSRWRLPLLCSAAALVLSQLLAPALAGQSPDWLRNPYNPSALMQKASEACQSDRFTFAAFGDSYARTPLISLLEMVDARSPDFVVTLGDMVDRGSGDRGMRNWTTLSERTGWFMRSRPTWPVIGNHELSEEYQAGLANYLRFYDLPDQNYSFTFRNAKFIVLGLDSEWRLVPPDHLAFLRKELADRDEYDHVFVFRHVPFYTVGMKGADQVPNTETELVKLLNERRVTATFTGHDHYYYRTRRDGVTHIISGVSGAGIYNLNRLAEQAPGDAYMGVSAAKDRVVLHIPGRVDRSVPFKGPFESGDEWLFAVFVHVNGDRVTADTVSMSGEVWDSFVLAGEPFGPTEAAAPATASASP